MNCLRALGKMCEILLEWSDRQHDVWTGRTVMVVCQQLFAFGCLKDDPQLVPWEWPDCDDVSPAELAAPVIRSLPVSNPYAASTPEELERQNRKMEVTVVNSSVEPEPRKNQETSESCPSAVEELPESKASLTDSIVRYSLHRCIYHHKFWNRVTFWEEALILTISEDLQKAALSERWQLKGTEDYEVEERNFRESNPCVGSLTSFGYSMITYGILRRWCHSC